MATKIIFSSKTCIFIAVLVLTVMSCHENDIVYNSKTLDYRLLEIEGTVTNVHIPLYESMLTKLNFDNLFVNDQGVICIRYTKTEPIEWSEEMGIDDYPDIGTAEWQYHLSELTLPMPESLVLTGFQINPVKLTTSNEAEGSYVNEAELSAGTLYLSVAVPASLTSYHIRVTIPELFTNEGDIFSKEFTPGETDCSVSLEGYKIKTENHQLYVRYDVTVSVNSSVSGDIVFSFSLTQMDVRYLSGYFGTLTHDEKGEINFDFFDELDGLEGAFGFKEIKIDTEVTNRTGVPMNVQAADFFFANESGFVKQLELSEPLAYSVAAATESGVNHAVTPVVESYSSTAPIIEFENKHQYPSKLTYTVVGEGNPGDIPHDNFILKEINTFLAKVDFTLTAPLYAKIEAYNRTEKVDFDYNEIVGNNEDNINPVEFVIINLLVDNGLPFDVTLEAIVINNNETFRQTVTSDINIAPNKYGQSIEIELDKDMLEDFRVYEVKKVIFQIHAKTQNVDYIMAKDTHFLDIAVSVRVKAGIPSNIFD